MSEAIAGVDELFGSPPKRRFKVVVLPVSGLNVRIRSLTEKEYTEYLMYFRDREGNPIRDRAKQASRIFISLCVVDEEGNRIIRTEHVDKMADWDAADANYLYMACREHTGSAHDDLEELEKNLGTTPGD